MVNTRSDGIAADDLLWDGACSAQCLLATDDGSCECRCGGDYHGALRYAVVQPRQKPWWQSADHTWLYLRGPLDFTHVRHDQTGWSVELDAYGDDAWHPMLVESLEVLLRAASVTASQTVAPMPGRHLYAHVAGVRRRGEAMALAHLLDASLWVTTDCDVGVDQRKAAYRILESACGDDAADVANRLGVQLLEPPVWTRLR